MWAFLLVGPETPLWPCSSAYFGNEEWYVKVQFSDNDRGNNNLSRDRPPSLTQLPFYMYSYSSCMTLIQETHITQTTNYLALSNLRDVIPLSLHDDSCRQYGNKSIHKGVRYSNYRFIEYNRFTDPV